MKTVPHERPNQAVLEVQSNMKFSRKKTRDVKERNNTLANHDDAENEPAIESLSLGDGDDGEIHEYFRTILEADRLRADEREDVAVVARIQAREQAKIDQARNLAAQQARRVYTCEACGLEFLGVLSFAEHDEETRHMTNRGKRVEINGSQ